MGRCVKKQGDNFVRKKSKCAHSTGYRGVRKTKGSCTYEARIGIVGERIHLGTYDNAEEAATAYDIISLKLHGDKAKTNFEKNKYTNFVATLDSFELHNLVGVIKDQAQFLSKLAALECKESGKGGGSSSTLTSPDTTSYQNDDQTTENDCQQTLLKLLGNLNSPTRQKRRKRKHKQSEHPKNSEVQDNSKNFEIFEDEQMNDQMSSQQNDFLSHEDDLQQFISSTPTIWNLDDEVLGKSICDQKLTLDGENEEEFESSFPRYSSSPLLFQHQQQQQQQIGDDLMQQQQQQQQLKNDFRLYNTDVLTGRSEFCDLQNPILTDAGFYRQQPLENDFQDCFQSKQNVCIVNNDYYQAENAIIKNYGRQNFWGNSYGDEILGCPRENLEQFQSRSLLNFEHGTFQTQEHGLTGNHRVTANLCANLNQRDFLGEDLEFEEYKRVVQQQQQIVQQQQQMVQMQQQQFLLRKQQQNENQLLIQQLYSNSPSQENTFYENIY